jgi:sulfatase modifying factor 1
MLAVSDWARVSTTRSRGSVAASESMKSIPLHAPWALRFFLPSSTLSLWIGVAALTGGAHTQTPIDPVELVAPAVELSGGNVNLTVQPSVAGRRYQLQYSDSLTPAVWENSGVERVGDGGSMVLSIAYDPAVPQRFYWLVLDAAPPMPPDGFILIPAGTFQMGDSFTEGLLSERPVHAVQVSAFYMGEYEVTKALWDEVRAWGVNHGYADLPAGEGKAVNHPVHTITWYAMVKWCNARSEKDALVPCYTVAGAIYRTGDEDAVACDWSANGHRLPTEAEWEKAARGGLDGTRFPWGDTITHSQANYFSSDFDDYDISATRGGHPDYDDGITPYSSPVGNFAPNGHGLHDMSGNMWERCWDWYSLLYYRTSPDIDPRGADSGSIRTVRGGGWGGSAGYCRVADRDDYSAPADAEPGIGFRLARSSVP